MRTPSLFERAVARHRAGDVLGAEDLYLQALAADPQDFRAAYNATATTMMTVALKNQQAAAEYT